MYKVCSRQFRGHGTWFFVFYFERTKNQASISSVLEDSIGSRYIFTHPQKLPERRFLGLLTPFSSKTSANSLMPSPDSDSMGKNAVKPVIIGQAPKSMSDSVSGIVMFYATVSPLSL